MWTKLIAMALSFAKRFWPIIVGVIGAVILSIVVAQCARRDTTAEQQAQQTTRSGEAAAVAAENAISTLENRTVTERNLETTVQQATKDINDAQTVDAIRDIVLDSVCRQSAHRTDPACLVRSVGP